jgi:ATP-dependent DNA ligase
MELPKLFKYTQTGAVQEWQIFFDNGEYYTVSGQVEGKKITNVPTKCKGKNIGKKNETSPEQQAELEARAKWQKKRDEGYTDDVDALDGANPQRYDPMLAKDYADYSDKLTFPVYSQPKLDGLRCVVTRHGAYSRQWKPFATLQHIREALRPLFDKYPELIAFDGEMYSHDLKDKFEEIVSIVKQPKASAEDIERCKNQIKYHVYDIVTKDNQNFKQRRADYNLLVREANSPYVCAVTTLCADDQKALDKAYRGYMADGYEGQMIRTWNSSYQHKRTKDLLKRKDFHENEFEIVGYKEGKGSREGCIILRLAMSDGTEFDSVPVGGVEYQQRLWNRRLDILGMQATVKYQNLSSDGVPRFNNTIKIRTRNLEEVNI